MQFQHLLGYPHLLRFCKEEQIPILPYSPSHKPLTISNIVVCGVQDVSRYTFKSRRKEINDCLEFGYKYGILNKERRSRLKGDSPKDYWSSVSELMVGLWLEKQGLNILGIEPPSSDGGKGDYLVESRGNTLFIEVKTTFGEKDFLNQQRMVRDLADYCREKRLPVERFSLLRYPNDYDYTSEKGSLLEDIEKTILGRLPISNRQTITYNGENGILIRIEIAPHVSHPLLYGNGEWSQIQDFLRARLGQNKLQVSAQNIPSICVINDFNSNIDKEDIEQFLYGRPVENYTRADKARIFREDNGRWSRKSPSGLNSVFVLRFEPYAVKIKTLDAYLCPNPKYELSKSIFSESNMTWWALDRNEIYIEAIDK
jgi:hypothetical protein